MMLDYETLRLVWWLLIGVLLVGLAIADGMDMGVGALLPFLSKDNGERRVMINTVAPHWDGNQVWLITAGGAIFAAWPTIYGAAFSGFYFAMLLVLAALFLRPLAFDYRGKIDDPRWRNLMDWWLFIGSVVPAALFGVAFGNLLQGVPFHLDSLLRVTYTGGFFGLLNPFALLAGALSVAMLTMHGAVWLQLRTTGELAARAAGRVRLFALISIGLFALAGVWVAFGIDGYRITSEVLGNATSNPLNKTVEVAAGAWLDNFNHYPVTLLAPTAGFLGAVLAMIFSAAGRPGLGFIGSSLSIAGIVMTAGSAMFPFIMPSSSNPASSLTMWDATSSPLTLSVMLVAAAVFIPLILFYTSWCYRRMWGKLTVEEIEARGNAAY